MSWAHALCAEGQHSISSSACSPEYCQLWPRDVVQVLAYLPCTYETLDGILSIPSALWRKEELMLNSIHVFREHHFPLQKNKMNTETVLFRDCEEGRVTRGRTWISLEERAEHEYLRLRWAPPFSHGEVALLGFTDSFPPSAPTCGLLQRLIQC